MQGGFNRKRSEGNTTEGVQALRCGTQFHGGNLVGKGAGPATKSSFLTSERAIGTSAVRRSGGGKSAETRLCREGVRKSLQLF